MYLDLIRSKPALDVRTEETYEYETSTRYYQGVQPPVGAIEIAPGLVIQAAALSPLGEDFVHVHLSFKEETGYRGDPPHARVSLNWDDVEAMIQTFIKKGCRKATQLDRARKLASALDEFRNIRSTHKGGPPDE